MSKNSSQGRRQASTHYHDAARRHQEAAHFAKSAMTEQSNARAKRVSTTNSRRTTRTKG